MHHTLVRAAVMRSLLHLLIDLSLLLDAIHFPSRLQETDSMDALCLFMVEKHLPDDTSHILSVLSHEAVTRMSGSPGLKARHETAFLCPLTWQSGSS